MKKTTQSGFAILELVLVGVVVLGVIGACVYVIQKRTHSASSEVSTSSSTPKTAVASPTTAVPTAPTVSSASDLQGAMNSLNQTSINSSSTDSSSLDSETSSF